MIRAVATNFKIADRALDQFALKDFDQGILISKPEDFGKP